MSSTMLNSRAGIRAIMLGLLACTYSTSEADPLDLADTALEVLLPVEPNILMLTDDSGSMDMSIMTNGPDEGGDGDMQIYGSRYFYTYPDPGASSEQPAYNRYAPGNNPGCFGGVALTEAYLKSRTNSAPYEGAWRAWNKDYNKVFYDPSVAYEPWKGVDSAGNEYGDADETAALFDPYRPLHGSLNLTTDLANYKSCYKGTTVTASGYYPARYYVWTDSNDDGVVDRDDGHTLYEIRTAGVCSTGATCPATFTRPSSRTDCGAPSGDTVTCTAAQEMQNFANWFSYYRKRDLAAKANFGSVVASNTSARIGFATINDNDNSAIKIDSMNLSPKSGPKKDLLDKIYDMLPYSGTPLRRNLEKAGKYFECASGDIFGSISSSLPGSADCPILGSAEGGKCQQNYTVLMTDGFYNGLDPAIVNADGDDNTDYDGGAFADSNNHTLADVAMDFYERDLQTGSNMSNEVPPTTNDKKRYPANGGSYPVDTDDVPVRMHQHMATYTLSFGIGSSTKVMPDNPIAAFVWDDPGVSNAGKIDDLLHAAYNGRGEYLPANNPVELKRALDSIFSEIGQAEGAASAVAFNTQNVDSGSLVFRAFFNTKTNTGNLVAHQVFLNGEINLDDEEWNAQEQLSRDYDSDSDVDNRVIITASDAGVASPGIPFRWADLSSGAGSQQEKLHQPVPTNVTDIGDERLEWIRGKVENEGSAYVNGEFHERVDADGVRQLLGDIVHSAPVFVGPPPYSRRDNPPFPTDAADLYSEFKLANLSRYPIVYVGANDGMLHAFSGQPANKGGGKEIFDYVPNIVFDNLSLLTDPDYSHHYYVDLTPSVNDVFMGGSWKTVLVGGLSAGGMGYYALDVTNPGGFSNETNAADKVMWEFDNSDDNALGYSFSSPLIAMSNDGPDGNKTWVAIFGNGYNSTSANGNAYLFVVNLAGGLDGVWDEGTDYIKIDTGNGLAQSGTNTPNGIGGIRGVDLDQNGTVDYVYAGDLQGNLYRFNLTGDMGSWDRDGVLYTTSYDGTGPTQPITNSPVVVQHPEQTGLIVIFGTGSWMTNDDRTDTSIQSIYGVWDTFGNLTDTAEVAFKELQEQEFVNQIDAINEFTVRTSTNNAINWKATGGHRTMGWYINLDMAPAGGSGVEFPGERAVRRFQIRGGLLFVNTIIPKKSDSDPCEVGVGGWELGFCPETGGAPDPTRNPKLDCDKIIFDVNADGSFNNFDNVGGGQDSADIVTGRRFDDSTPADSSFIGDTQVTQTSDKSIRTTKTNTGNNALQGRHSWREVEL